MGNPFNRRNRESDVRMTDDLFFKYLQEDCGYKDVKKMNENSYVAISNMIYTAAIIVGHMGDMVSYYNRWCYHTYDSAKKALDAWDGTGEPSGWHRHPASGRRVSETGEEYINL